MKNITSELEMEHQNILGVIQVVLGECSKLESSDREINVPFFSKVVEFIQKYADGYHHVKEEDILFVAMLENRNKLHCNPIPVMLHEHDEGRNYVGKMKNALANIDKQLLIESARGYCQLLQNHIYKEDNVLYPMAEAALDEAQKDSVNMAYQKVDASKFLGTDIDTFISDLKRELN
jgi:Uncharacterized conserved protein